ncbi:hypothetical protein [Nonomuraea sp. NEAU-A123]|uniref:hypothetical protein n=1 Tax=Nonomuraea sp. NEAU-A123 TaxID=2839649 RepID=UPI001BE41C00|nr:hypothetical protein [Nonomuraea sp. NEAU-A123]MBT2235778.1 hypothetical protein [Nonomuraea sp. NEAU-A123]
MVTRKSPWPWISLLVGGLIAGALGVIFIVLDLEQADQLASVVGVFVALAGLSISIYGVVLARRGEDSSPDSSPATAPPSSAGTITASGEGSVAVRDNSGVIQTGDAGHATITGTGDTKNTIKGGTFHAPVTMARDITGPPTAQPPLPPASSSDDPNV